MRRNALPAAALLAAALCPGCMTVKPDAVTALGGSASTRFSYLGGRATQNFGTSPVTVQPAVLAAMDDLRIVNVRQTNDSGALVFDGTTPDNRRATVMLRPMPSGASRVTARIGLFGDEPLSRALMDRVGIRLGALPPQAIPAESPSEPGSNPYFSKAAVPDSTMLKDQADAPYRGSDAP